MLVFADYTSHLEAMRGVLPDDVLELATLPGVDDGLIVFVEHDRERRIFTLIMRCGDLQVGYFDLELVYEDAEISRTDEWILARIAREIDEKFVGNDVAYHEVDVTKNGTIEHRILFHPGRFVTIRCRVLRWSTTLPTDPELPEISDRFPGGPKVSARGRTWRSQRRHWERAEEPSPAAVFASAGRTQRLLEAIRKVRNL